MSERNPGPGTPGPDECRYCGTKVGEEQPYGFWVTGGETADGWASPADERRYCADAPDHLHAADYPEPDDIECGLQDSTGEGN